MNQKTRAVPRGIRNNNPLNIRIGNVWLGEVQNPTDPEFEQFVHIKYGLRAGFVLLRRYINHYHRNTVPMILAAWAPSSENNTIKYIDYVCQMGGEHIVGFGSDFDGIECAPRGLSGADEVPNLLDALRRRGMSEEAVSGIAGGNLLRYFSRI